MRYDPLGRLFEVEGFTAAGVSNSVRRLLYDGDALIAEYNAAGTMLSRYIHGPNAGSDDPLAEYIGAGVLAANRRNLYADARGSVVLRTTATGTTPQINAYDEFGIPGSSNVGRFQYTGQAWVPELGMYYYKARIYSPSLGRFLQTDPIGYKDQVNLYTYVGNDPVNKVDPDGLNGIEKCSATSPDCGGSGSGTEPNRAHEQLLEKFPIIESYGKKGGSRKGKKGERRQAGKPSGTPSEFKNLRRSQNDPTKVYYKDRDGKNKRFPRAGTTEELDYLNETFGPPKLTTAQEVVKASKYGSAIATVTCLLGPGCGLVDRDSNNRIDVAEVIGFD